MGILGKRATFETLRTFDLTTLAATYLAVGTVLPNPSIMLKLVNTSAVPVTVSFNGVTDHDVILPASTVIYNFGSNAQSQSSDHRLALPETTVYVRGAAVGGAGTLFHVVSVYQGN